MFSDYPFLRWWLDKIELEDKGQRQENALHRHLRWLIARGENRPIATICPVCGQRPISEISILGLAEFGYSMGLQYTCCSDCKKATEALAWPKKPQFLKPRFSSISWFENKQDQQEVVRLLKQIFKLPWPLTRQRAFEFFAAEPTPVIFATHQLHLPAGV